jgi:hypothetical protein
MPHGLSRAVWLVAGGSPTPFPQPSHPCRQAGKVPPEPRLETRARVFRPLDRLGLQCGPGMRLKVDAKPPPTNIIHEERRWISVEACDLALWIAPKHNLKFLKSNYKLLLVPSDFKKKIALAFLKATSPYNHVECTSFSRSKIQYICSFPLIKLLTRILVTKRNCQ